jgi:hypothetical protein
MIAPINKVGIVAMTTDRCLGRAPHVLIDKIKRFHYYTIGKGKTQLMAFDMLTRATNYIMVWIRSCRLI